MNPLIPIAGVAAFFLLMGRGKKREEEEEEEIFDEEEEAIEEEPLGGSGPDYGDGPLGGDGDGDGGGPGDGDGDGGLGGEGLGPISGVTVGTGTATGGGRIPKGGPLTRDPFGREGSGGSLPTITARTATATFPKIDIKTATAVPAAPGEDESTQEDIDESVDRQEDIERQGKKDSNLRLCQGALFALGVGKPPKGKWGYYNSTTKEHLKTFQRNHGLQETGVCDIETKRKLDYEIRRRSSPKFCFGQEECSEFALKALHSKTALYVPLKTDPNTGETLEGAYYRVGPNAKIYYEAYEPSIGISPVLTGAWPFQNLPWQSRYAIEKKIDRTGGDLWEVGKTIEQEIFAGRVPGPGDKFGA
jgi:hypothetical protein